MCRNSRLPVHSSLSVDLGEEFQVFENQVALVDEFVPMKLEPRMDWMGETKKVKSIDQLGANPKKEGGGDNKDDAYVRVKKSQNRRSDEEPKRKVPDGKDGVDESWEFPDGEDRSPPIRVARSYTEGLGEERSEDDRQKKKDQDKD